MSYFKIEIPYFLLIISSIIYEINNFLQKKPTKLLSKFAGQLDYIKNISIGSKQNINIQVGR